MARFWFRPKEMSTARFARSRIVWSTRRLTSAGGTATPPLRRTSYHRSGEAPTGMREGRGRGRVAAAILLAAVGASAAAAGFIGLGIATARSVRPLREATASAAEQRFAFDRSAWRAVALDDVFPPVAHTVAGEAMPGALRDYTRIGVAPVADCRTAFDPDLARLLAAYPCGP